MLRKELSGLYQALRAIFGEMDAAGVAGTPSSVPPTTSAIWESWKEQLPGAPAKLIDALLIHGEMNAVQLRVAMHCHINTVYETTAKMQKMGLLNKNGGKYSLKEL